MTEKMKKTIDKKVQEDKLDSMHEKETPPQDKNVKVVVLC